jgi:hypothetical protein
MSTTWRLRPGRIRIFVGEAVDDLVVVGQARASVKRSSYLMAN